MPPREFDPRFEHEMLGYAPPEDKAERVREFERQRLEQRIGIATVGGLVIETIVREPDTPRQQLLDTFEEYRGELRLAGYQRALAKELIAEYSDRHRRVSDLYGTEEDDRERFRRLFPRFKDARTVSVAKRPANLHVVVDPKTYEALGGGDSSGFFRPADRLYTFERSTYRGGQESTMLHEEQHAVFDLLTRTAEKRLGKSVFRRAVPDIGEVERRSAHEGERQVVSKYVRSLVTADGDRIKDEILAFTRSADISPGQLLKILTADGNGYDYWERAREELTAYLSKGRHPGEAEDAVEAARADFERSRHRLTASGIEAVRALKTELGFNHWQATLLLFDRPLERWPEEVAKLRNYSVKE